MSDDVGMIQSDRAHQPASGLHGRVRQLHLLASMASGQICQLWPNQGLRGWRGQ